MPLSKGTANSPFSFKYLFVILIFRDDFILLHLFIYFKVFTLISVITSELILFLLQCFSRSSSSARISYKSNLSSTGSLWTQCQCFHYIFRGWLIKFICYHRIIHAKQWSLLFRGECSQLLIVCQ